MDVPASIVGASIAIVDDLVKSDYLYDASWCFWCKALGHRGADDEIVMEEQHAPTCVIWRAEIVSLSIENHVKLGGS